MSERLANFLPEEVKERLKAAGRRVSLWQQYLKRAQGDEAVAQVLADLEGEVDLGALPSESKPKVEGPSLRIAAQKEANNWRG